MTREIRFRIWDGSQMNYDVLVGKLGAYYASIDPKDTASVINTKYPENIIPMQYTGLKDKNGNKIYEGDRLKHPNSGIFEVRFHNHGFKLFYNNVEHESNNTQYMEVIGNIYQ